MTVSQALAQVGSADGPRLELDTRVTCPHPCGPSSTCNSGREAETERGRGQLSCELDPVPAESGEMDSLGTCSPRGVACSAH